MLITLVLYEGQDKSIENKGVCKYYFSVAQLSLTYIMKYLVKKSLVVTRN